MVAVLNENDSQLLVDENVVASTSRAYSNDDTLEDTFCPKADLFATE